MVKKICSLIIYIIIVLVLVFNISLISIKAKSRNKLEILVAEKLKCNFVDYEIMYDFNLKERYILVTGENCYLIYDMLINDYVEFSNNSKSWYEGIYGDKKKVYLLPTYYFYYDGDNYISIYDNKKIEKEELELYKNEEKMLTDRYSDYQKLNMSALSSACNYISGRYYFENLNTNIGNNSSIGGYEGSCSYISFEMILQYYDNVLNDDIIFENYDVGTQKSILNYCDIDISSFESPGVDDNFHDFMINFGRINGYTSVYNYYLLIWDMGSLMNDYFSMIGMHNINHLSLLLNVSNFCRNAIDSNNPVIIGLLRDPDGKDYEHNIVGYGYDSSGIITHFGYKTTSSTNMTSVNINGYVVDSAFYISLSEEHSCSNNYAWQSLECNGCICSCGNISCTHNYIYSNSYEVAGHSMVCTFCCNSILNAHNFVPSGLGYRCSICNYYTRRPISVNFYGGELSA